MRELDWATKFELYWRDLFFWIFARPAGILYTLISPLIIFPLALIVRGVLFASGWSGATHISRITCFLKKEIFTLANCVTLYGLFLYGELLYTLFTSWNGEKATLYALSIFFIDENASLLTKISWLVTEIFLTDMLDGPLARVNSAVTALGTFLDHSRDYGIGFTALFILLFSAADASDRRMIIFLLFSFVGFFGIFFYHMKFLRLKLGTHEFSAHSSCGVWMYEHIQFLYKFALNEYQTNLLGRIQFGALAVSIMSGLFFYALGSKSADLIFSASCAIMLISTYWYLATLWNVYYEHMHSVMKEKSEKLKLHMISKTKEMGKRASKHKK